ncbi:glycosyltransferase family 2 protein [Changchengzhania lutea]|uniref:glycosyltransferase family 2 protein n=1 Tax=Changchengzhania lutea TaxID=2049305 RepID=UPI00115F1E2A|nr:glycosyltransferase family 2 protein [Changchengzhania lutea]
MKEPLVSILTPFKNTESFLEDCLNSILNQSYQNWELLIVDDHSTDASYALVNRFAEKDQRIKLFKNADSGIIDALRVAFKHSRGEFVTRMDSDDVMRPNKLETLVGNLLQYGKQHVSIGLVDYFSADGIKEGYKNYETWLNDLTKTGTNYSEIYKECVIPSPCWMAYKSDLIACGAFEPNRYPEDYDLAFRFYKYHYTCIPCDIVLHNWRDYSTRASRTDAHYAENHFIDLKLDYFLELDYDDTKTLVVWGAGNKGKLVAKQLIKKGIDFEWICDNPKKIGKDIYGKILKPFNALETMGSCQSIITVANRTAQKDIKNYLANLDLQPITGYIFFC